MKKFIGYIVILGLTMALSIIFVFSKADGNANAFYLKMASPKKNNLILGTSKAAQGLQPAILKNLHQKSFYNYAFALNSSPYGKTYLQSIQYKLNTKDLNQTFILAVDPWSLSATTADPNDQLNFRETKTYLSKISNPNQKINYQYLLHYFDESYYKIFFKNPVAFLHDDGWLEVTLPEDSLHVNRRSNFTISDYRSKAANYHFSKVRYDYLLKTIQYLNNYGSIYLVRLPVHSDLLNIENQIMPTFNTEIQTAINLSQGYLDLTEKSSSFQYTDGVHLTKSSGKQVSTLIGRWITN